MRAGIYYYEYLARAQTARGKKLHLVMAHADLDAVLAAAADRRYDELARSLEATIAGLARGGATLAAISAMTPHVCFGALAASSPIPLIGIAEPIARALRERGVRRIALFGTRFVVESDLFGMLAEVDVVRPMPDEVDEIHALYAALAARGKASDDDRERLEVVGERLVRRERLDAILLAGTDLSPVFDERPAGFPTIDASHAHLHAIIEAL